jgi:hypothetical protein
MGLVNTVSTARKLGYGVAAIRRAASSQKNRRLASALFSGARTTLLSFFRVLHLLWLQTTGLFFLVFCAVCAGAAVREYRHYAAGEPAMGKLILSAAVALMFGYFAVSSFWRAAKKSRTASQS